MEEVIIYARRSPSRYVEESESIETQLDICERYCAERGYVVIDRKWDKGVSGASASNREGLREAIGMLKKGRVLVCYSSSRLARGTDLFEHYVAMIARRKAQIEFVDEGRLKTDIWSVAMRKIKAIVLDLERAQTAKRTSDAALRMQAVNIAVSKIPPYGKTLGPVVQVQKQGRTVDRQMWEDDPAEQAVVDQIVDMGERGFGLREIARKLNREGVPSRGKEWSHVAVRRILKRSKVIGKQ